MIKITYLFIFLFAISSFSQAQNKVDAKGKKQGEWVKTYEKKKNILYKGTFQDDLPVGKFVFYHENGKVKAISRYSNKGQDSYVASYYDNGKVLSYGKYINKKKDSSWVYYDEWGFLSSTETYQRGEKNGKSIVYYPYNRKTQGGRPKILELTNYVDGVREGEWIKYLKNGAKLGEGNYSLDQYDGKQTYYHSNGNKKTVFHYKRGVKNGYSFFYDGNGKEVSKQYYLRGIELKGEVLKKHLAHKKKQKMKQTSEGN